MEKRTKILSGIFLCGLALGFALVFAIALIGGVHILPVYRMEPEDILPGAQTVLLLKHPEAKDIALWSALFPSLLDVRFTDPNALAIVRDASGGLHVFGFTRKTSRNDEGCIIGKYRIFSAENDQCPDMLNAHEENMLRKDAGYKALGKPPKGSWVFVRRDAIPEGQNLMSRIMESSILSSASHIRLSREDDDGVITFWPLPPPLHTYDAPALPVPGSLFSVGTGNLRESLEHVLSTLSIHDRLTARGLLLTHSATLFGPDISLEHRLIPLLTEDASFAVLQTASGSRVLIGGSAETTSDASNAADALHTAFRLRHPDVTVIERTFDNRFPLKTMRVSEERISEESGTIHDWDIHITRDSEDNRLLITALQGRAIRMSDSAEFLIASLAQSEGIPIPASRRPIAKKTVLAAALPALWLTDSPLLRTILPSGTEGIVMVMEQLGETGYVRLQEKREERREEKRREERREKRRMNE